MNNMKGTFGGAITWSSTCRQKYNVNTSSSVLLWTRPMSQNPGGWKLTKWRVSAFCVCLCRLFWAAMRFFSLLWTFLMSSEDSWGGDGSKRNKHDKNAQNWGDAVAQLPSSCLAWRKSQFQFPTSPRNRISTIIAGQYFCLSPWSVFVSQSGQYWTRQTVVNAWF